MVDILSALSGGMNGEDYYLSKDPYFLGGSNLLRNQLPIMGSGAASYAAPFLQGLLGSGLVSYGRNNANKAAFQDYSTNPLLSAIYGQSVDEGGNAVMPEGWNIRKGQQDLLLAALGAQQTADAVQEQRKNALDISKALAGQGKGLSADGTITLLPGAAEAEAALAAAKESAGPLPGVPKSMTDSVLAESTIKAGSEKSDKEVDALYEKAKAVPSSKAMLSVDLPFLPKVQSIQADQIDQINANLQAIFQKRVGPEPSDKFRAQLSGFMVTPLDSKKSIESKKEGFKDLVTSLTQATPVIDALEKKGPKYPGGDGPGKTEQAYEIRTTPDGQKYKVLLGQ